MAKKDDMELEEYNFDDELNFDMPDFNGEDVKDDRNPVTKVASGVVQGAKDTLLDPSHLKGFVRKAMPREYGEASSLVGQATGTLKDLYDTSAKELKPVVKDLRKFTKRVLPITDKLPKGLADRIKTFANKEENGGYDQGNALEAAIASAQADIFKMQAETDATRDTKNETQDNIKEGMNQKRHLDQIGQLDSIRGSVNKLAAYQETVTVGFQRKSLELQFRQYFTAQETLEEIKKLYAVSDVNLQAISKNSALPEYVKITKSEAMGEAMRNQFIGSLTEGLMDKRNNFLRNFGESIRKKGTEKIKGIMGSAREGLDMANQMAEMNESMREMGVNIDPAEIGGSMIGGDLATRASTALAKKISPILSKKPGLLKFFNKIIDFGNNAGLNTKEFLENYQGPGAGGEIHSALTDSTNDALRLKTGIQTDNLASNVNTAVVWNRQHGKTINEIIPGFLSRIYRELKIMRTGDVNQELLAYDLTSNKFDKESTIKTNVFNSFIKKENTEQLDRNNKNVMELLDSDGTKFNEEERKRIRSWLMKFSKDGKFAPSAKTFSEDDAYYGGGVDDLRDRLQEAFADQYKDDHTHARTTRLNAAVGQSLYGVDDPKLSAQNIDNASYGNILREAGVMDDKGNIDYNKFYQLHFSDDGFNIKPEYADGGLNGKGFKQKGPKGGKQKPQPSISSPPPAASPAASPITQPSTVNFDTSPIVEAINNNSTKTVSEKMSETLLRMEILLKGIEDCSCNDGGGSSGEGNTNSLSSKFKNLRMGELPAWFTGKLGKGYEWGRDTVKEGFGNAMKFGAQAKDFGSKWGGKGLGLLGKGYDVAFGKGKEIYDVYLKDMPNPILLADKLKNGDYRLETDLDKVIKKFKDITGNVVDITKLDANGKPTVVLRYDDIKDAYIRIGNKATEMKGLVGKAFGLAKEFAGNQAAVLFKGAAWVGNKALGMLNNLVDPPQDVYVKGSPEPKLLALVMKNGGYLSRTSGKVISSPSQIDGVIIDSNGDVILSNEDLQKGLTDKEGNEIKTGIGRYLQIITKRAKQAWGLLDKGFKAAKGFASKVGSGLSDGWTAVSNWFNEASPVVIGTKKTNNILEEIRDILLEQFPRKGKVIGDLDGDGDRDGSLADLKQKAKDAGSTLKEKGSGLFGSAKAGLLAAGGGLKSVWDKYTKKKDDEEAAEDAEDSLLEQAGDLADIADFANGDGGNGEPKKRGRLSKAKRSAKLKVGKGMRGLKGLGARGLGALGTGAGAIGKWTGLSGAGRGVAATGRGAMSLGRGVATVGAGAAGAGLLAGGLKAYDTSQNAISDEDKVSGYAGAAGAAAGAMAGMKLGAIGGTFIGGPIGTVVGGAAGLILGGLGGYFGGDLIEKGVRKLGRMFKGKLTAIEELRLAHYGFLPSEKSEFDKIMDLESNLEHAVIFGDGAAKLNTDKLDIQAIFDIYGINKDDPKQVAPFKEWLLNRFKPVFLAYKATLDLIKKGSSILDISKLTGPEKKDFLAKLKIPGSIYKVTASPIGGSLKATSDTVSAAMAAAKKESEVDTLEPKSGFFATAAKAVLSAVVPGAAAAYAASELLKKPESNKVETPEEKAKKDLAKAAGGAAVSATAVIADSGTSRVDAFTSVRMKTYGLNDLDNEKVKQLTSLEKLVNKGISFKGDTATWNGSSQAVITEIGPEFGIDANGADAKDWMNWFDKRFLPTYLNYLTALCAATGKKDPSGVNVLTPQQNLDIATTVFGTKVDGTAVWGIEYSPWFGYIVNASVKSIDGNMQALRDKVKSKTLADEEGRKKALNKSDGKTNAEETSWTDKAKNAASGAWDSVKSFGNKVIDKNIEYANKAKDVVVDSTNYGLDVVSDAASSITRSLKGNAKANKEALIAAMDKAGITDPKERAMILAQADHESGGFKSMEEKFNYRSADRLMSISKSAAKLGKANLEAAMAQGPQAVAEAMYGGRMGNGKGNGDAFKYRGRGQIQLTGRDNYGMYGKAIGIDLLTNPDLLLDPAVAAQATLAFWKKRNLSGPSQAGDVVAATKIINGGTNGLEDRKKLFQSYMAELGAPKGSPKAGPNPPPAPVGPSPVKVAAVAPAAAPATVSTNKPVEKLAPNTTDVIDLPKQAAAAPNANVKPVNFVPEAAAKPPALKPTVVAPPVQAANLSEQGKFQREVSDKILSSLDSTSKEALMELRMHTKLLSSVDSSLKALVNAATGKVIEAQEMPSKKNAPSLSVQRREGAVSKPLVDLQKYM